MYHYQVVTCSQCCPMSRGSQHVFDAQADWKDLICRLCKKLFHRLLLNGRPRHQRRQTFTHFDDERMAEHYLKLGCSRDLPCPSKCPSGLGKSLGERVCTTKFPIHPFSPQCMCTIHSFGYIYSAGILAFFFASPHELNSQGLWQIANLQLLCGSDE